MYFKKISKDEAVYRKTIFVKILMVLLFGLFFCVGLINVFMSDKPDSMPIWVSGFICWLGWVGAFGGYSCRFDLENKTIQVKASNLYTILNRIYRLSEIKGFRAISGRGVLNQYRIYAVLNDDTHVAIANHQARATAIDDCKKMAEFVGKPYQIDIASL